MSPELPPCAGRHELFESSEPDDIAAAIGICKDCPMIQACTSERERLIADGYLPFGVWAGYYGGSQNVGIPRFYGDRNPDRIAAEEEAYSEDEAREAYLAYRKEGDRSEWAVTGNRVYERRRKAAQRRGVAA